AVRLAESAFNVGAGHARQALPIDHGVASCAAGYAVATAIIWFADDGQRLLLLFGLGALLGRFCHGNGLAGARRWIERLLAFGGLLGRAALACEGQVPGFVDAAVNACGKRGWGAKK